MPYVVPLDPKSKSIILIKFYTKVKNVPELRKEIINGELHCCILKPSLILDPFQIVIAANKAVIAEKITTKSIYTELLFNLSISKNITQSLQKFGINDDENSLIVAVIKKIDDNDEIERKIFEKINGEELDLTELSSYSNVGLIKKAYKINDVEFKKIPLLDSVISRIATKDIISV